MSDLQTAIADADYLDQQITGAYDLCHVDGSRVMRVIGALRSLIPSEPTPDVRDGVAKAMCAVETRSKAATLEEVQAGIQRWTRHRYEAERLIGELADFGFDVRPRGQEPTQDEREAAMTWARDHLGDPDEPIDDYAETADSLLASPLWRDRGQAEPTDAEVEAAARLSPLPRLEDSDE